MTPPRAQRILVVDDDPGIRDALHDLLHDEGYQLATAPDGVVALEVLRASPDQFGLILLDLMMPNMDGYTFRTTQLCDPAVAQIPVVVLSAGGNMRERGLPEEVSTELFLTKPFAATELFTLIERLIGPAPWA